MNQQWKWVNQFQPQTLYLATILCYLDAVFGLLFGTVAHDLLHSAPVPVVVVPPVPTPTTAAGPAARTEAALAPAHP